MSRRAHHANGTFRTSPKVADYVKLERRLVLLAWLNELLGFDNNRALLKFFREADEGFDASGRSFIHHLLIARSDTVKILEVDLARYDENIRTHVQAMNAQRTDHIILRYFQYLAALYTEIYLDYRFNHPKTLLKALNDFVGRRNASVLTGDPKDERFSEIDLQKIAFWMATGSGKTLLMHINYRQFLHYNNMPLDNVLLVTPNEGLSEQHIVEMTASNVPCRRFNLNDGGSSLSDTNEVLVIEITKLSVVKRGGGESVPVEAFDGNNLIFVDEGHKGTGGEAWRKIRDALGETGFTFEYSATFGQALTAARNAVLTAEYGKAIAFDYSYKYFHGDGYGKDFRILNLRDETTVEMTETLLLGNLLSFYEQLRVFEERSDELRPYNLEKPLWVFVGSTVNAVYTADHRKQSDVLTVIRFLHHLLGNRNGWAVKAIDRILTSKTGLADTYGADIFTGKFGYLKSTGISAEIAYGDILKRVLHAPAEGALHMTDLRGSDGELGLKASGAEDYFGLIYIGDTSAFKQLVEADDSGIVLEDDALTGSLFGGINQPDTLVNILIGAKKFMEGWNSWRVSSMGLLNIGRSEGSEIIQLFGRGVRLRGRDFSLKRSSALLDGTRPQHIELLENLNIFAVRANYMAQFRDYLVREGVETEGDYQIPLHVLANDDFLGLGLYVPRLPGGRSFTGEINFSLDVDSTAKVQVDMSLKVEVLESMAAGIKTTAASAGREVRIPAESLELVDWEQIYLDLLGFKERKGMRNLVIRPNIPRDILSRDGDNRIYSLLADDGVVRPTSFEGRYQLNQAVLAILQKYTDKFYRVRQERWNTEQMEYRQLVKEDPNFQDYVVTVPRGESKLILAIEKLIEEGTQLYKQDLVDLPTIHFDRHLYQPLIVEGKNVFKSEPPALNDSETQFVSDLRAYCYEQKDMSLMGAEIFLLRNLSRGKGIGFFEARGFYPDFILWIKRGSSQRIVFVDPHGMIHADSYEYDPKAKLHEDLPSLAKRISERTGVQNVSLDSYIVTPTDYSSLKRKYGSDWDRKKFADHHILFLDRNKENDYVDVILTG